jgi:hypothetical protein
MSQEQNLLNQEQGNQSQEQGSAEAIETEVRV